MSMDDYVQVTGDKELKQLISTNVILVMHNKTQVLPKGSAWLLIERKGHVYNTNFHDRAWKGDTATKSQIQSAILASKDNGL